MDRRLAIWLLLLTALCAGRASAQRNHSVFYDQSQGLDSGEVSALAQDREGYIWLGTFAGLIRFDGRTFKPWGRERLREPTALVTTHGDELVAFSNAGIGYVRSGNTLQPWIGPDGRAVRDARFALFDRDGRLWAIFGERLWRRGLDRRWQAIDAETIDSELPWRLTALRDGVALITKHGAWVLRGDDPPRRLLRQPGLFAAVGGGRAPYWFVGHRTDNNGTNRGPGDKPREDRLPLVWRLDARGLRAFPRPLGSVLDMVEHDGTVWVSTGELLITIDGQGGQRVQDLRQGIASGGPLLVDREASLWLGTYVGLLHFPGPRTWQWTKLEGLRPSSIFRAAPYREQVWATTSMGAVRFDATTMRMLPKQEFEARVSGVPCEDGRGGLWLIRDGAIQYFDGVRLHPTSVPARLPSSIMNTTCIADSQGGLWLNATVGVYRIEGADARAIELSVPKGAEHGEFTVLGITEQGELLRVAGGYACWYRVDAEPPLRPRRCIAAPRPAGWGALQRVGAQRYWYGSLEGLQELRGESIRRLPGNDTLAVNYLSTMYPSPRGGYWIAGGGTLLRLAPCGDCARSWQVLERPGAMQGLPGNAATEGFELRNGDLWMIGNRGVLVVPASERQIQLPPPNLKLVRVRVGGAEHDPDRPLHLSPQQRRLELEYAALTYRDRSLLRFRSRTSDRQPWSAPGTEPILQLIDLSAGAYRVQMQASLDGEHWSSARAFAFDVAPPWWATWWARLIWLSLLLGVGVVLYRLRVQQLLRLERQRNEIAMDLHDEMGSGLGSISVLANVAAREGYDESERRQIAGEIASVAELLGGGLRSLVWTMRESRAGLADLAAQLAQHAGRLLPGPEPELRIHWPQSFPPGGMQPQVRRHVLMIALEALHNAARHSRASEVVVELSAHDTQWRLRIDDDGIGFDPEHPARRSGLDTMRQRAGSIGARLELHSAVGAGTRIAVYFDPFGA